MNKHKYFIMLAMSVPLFTGCAPYHGYSGSYTTSSPSFYRPSEQEKANADYGKYPDDYEKIVKDYMGGVLKDPESARYRFDSSPTKSYAPAETKQGIRYCWVVNFKVNAKNGYGGYGGEQIGVVWIKDGRIIHKLLEWEVGLGR